MDSKDKAFQKGLARLRKEKGWTQSVLKTKSEVQHQLISNIETGKRRASLDAQWALAKAFGLTPEGVIKRGEDIGTKPKTDQENFNNRLNILIKNVGCTQNELASYAKVNPRTANRWLKGISRPRHKAVMGIQKATGYYWRWLMEDEFEGPRLLSAQWVYANKDFSLSSQQIAALYERIDEIMGTLGLNKYKLINFAKINTTINPDVYFIGDNPSINDIKKIADATGYRPDWILKGLAPKKLDSEKNGSDINGNQYDITQTPYPEQKEQVGSNENQRNPGGMSYSATGLGTVHFVTAIDRPDIEYIQDVKEILESEHTSIISALKSNIVQFREMVKDKGRMAKLEKQVEQLTTQLKVEKNGNDSLNNPVDNAENE